MKDRRSVWLIVMLLVGFPAGAYALDISGTIGILFEILAMALMPVFVLILVIVLIYKFVKKKG
jgi:uncharacterized membrane protein